MNNFEKNELLTSILSKKNSFGLFIDSKNDTYMVSCERELSGGKYFHRWSITATNSLVATANATRRDDVYVPEDFEITC